jgi:hypothetical protein
MKAKWLSVLLVVMMLLVTTAPVAAAIPQQDGSSTRLIPAGGTTRISGMQPVATGIQQPEFRPKAETSDGQEIVNREHPKHKGQDIFPDRPLRSPRVKSSEVATSNPELELSFEGLNHFDQRFANNGNQFSLEPPDQALCVGNGYVVEAVNSVLRVWDTSGNALTGVQDLNTFFGYPAAIDRTTGEFGPQVIDPVCYYDPENQRFVVVITTLHSLPDGTFTGRNTIDVAVSNTGDPTGDWTIYYVPAQNDGTEGTPNHGCTLDGKTPGPCFQDYPHVGADQYGVYVSTNEYDLFGPNFNAAQIFAFSKQELAAHPATIHVTLVENLRLEGTPGWTVWPAISPAGEYSLEANGTEYLLSTIAGDGTETGNPTGTARHIGLWALTNTQSLDSASPALKISSRAIRSQTYVFPPTSDQKPGDIPLGECLNDTSAMFPNDHPDLFDPPYHGNLGCWFLFLDPPPTWQPEVLSHPDSLDSRMQQTWYVNGIIWGSAGTAVRVGGEIKAGIAWFAVDPEIDKKGAVNGKVEKQDYIALANNNLTMPAIAIGSDGQGAIAFSVMGEDYYPSAGYVLIDEQGHVSPIHIAAAGLGPDDGFTSYKAFVGDPPRTRWGDYGAAVTDGETIWIGSEYIAQTCDFETWLNDFTCGGTRTALANWSTRLSKLNP